MIMKKIQIPMRKTLRTVRILRRLKDLRILLKIQGILMMKIQSKENDADFYEGDSDSNEIRRYI